MSRKLRSPALLLAAMVLVLAGCGDDDPTPPGNHAPTARAGNDQIVRVGGTARLLGTGVDENPGDALTYAWTLVTKPAGSGAVIANAGQAAASFIADSVGVYVASLTVSDGKAEGSDTVTITANRAASPHPVVPYAG